MDFSLKSLSQNSQNFPQQTSNVSETKTTEMTTPNTLQTFTSQIKKIIIDSVC